MSDTSNANKSFAERFGKKSSGFSSEAIKSSADSQAPASSKPKSAVDPLKRSQAEYIYLVKGIDNSRKAWYYVLVERLKVQLFLKALNDDIIHLENYGKILFSAYGEEPPASITQQLKDEYGIDG
jgi:hypothetical protein